MRKYEDLTKQKFGRLTVLERADDHIQNDGRKVIMWKCICDCQTNQDAPKYSYVSSAHLKRGDTKSCGCYRSQVNFEDLSGKVFGRLTVIKIAKRIRGKDGKPIILWECECSCEEHNHVNVRTAMLKNGNTKSCGCLNKEKLKQRKKYNTYDLQSQEFGIGYTTKGEEFWFDKEDYDLIKDYYWQKDKQGYIYSNSSNKRISLHRLIMNVVDNENIEIDHIFQKREDNRKSQLRFATSAENSRNVGLRSNNTSGVTGVDWAKREQKWRARIRFNNKEIHLGLFKNFNDAVKARKDAEIKYFKEFQYKEKEDDK